MKRALITHWCFSYCQILLTQHQGLFCLSDCSSPVRRLEKEKLRGNTADPTRPKRYSTMFHTMLCTKSCGQEGRREDTQRNGVCVHSEVCQSPAPLGTANTCLPMGAEWIPGFVLLAHAVFVLLLSQHVSFHVFTLLMVSPISLWQSEWAVAGAELPAKAEPQPVPKAGSGQRILCKCTTVLSQFSLPLLKDTLEDFLKFVWNICSLTWPR